MTIFFIVLSLRLFAPTPGTLFVTEAEAVNPYERLIYAIGMVECSHDTTAINEHEGAVGFFQIRQVRIDHYNKMTGSCYVPEDMLDYLKAEKVFMYYALQIGFRDMEKIARSWNGSGPITITYWNKVKSYL